MSTTTATQRESFALTLNPTVPLEERIRKGTQPYSQDRLSALGKGFALSPSSHEEVDDEDEVEVVVVYSIV